MDGIKPGDISSHRHCSKAVRPSCLRRSIPISTRKISAESARCCGRPCQHAHLPRITHYFLLSDPNVGIRLDDRLDLCPQPLPGVCVVDMVEDKVPQLVRAKEGLGGLDRVDIVRVALRRGRHGSALPFRFLFKASTYLILQPRQGRLDEFLHFRVFLALSLVVRSEVSQ
jgi:hypothetical protein